MSRRRRSPSPDDATVRDDGGVAQIELPAWIDAATTAAVRLAAEAGAEVDDILEHAGETPADRLAAQVTRLEQSAEVAEVAADLAGLLWAECADVPPIATILDEPATQAALEAVAEARRQAAARLSAVVPPSPPLDPLPVPEPRAPAPPPRRTSIWASFDEADGIVGDEALEGEAGPPEREHASASAAFDVAPTDPAQVDPGDVVAPLVPLDPLDPRGWLDRLRPVGSTDPAPVADAAPLPPRALDPTPAPFAREATPPASAPPGPRQPEAPSRRPATGALLAGAAAAAILLFGRRLRRA
jgi:hypothetical protein